MNSPTHIAQMLSEYLNELGIEVVECDYERMDDMIYAKVSIEGHEAYIRGDYKALKNMDNVLVYNRPFHLNVYDYWSFKIHSHYERGTLLDIKNTIEGLRREYKRIYQC